MYTYIYMYIYAYIYQLAHHVDDLHRGRAAHDGVVDEQHVAP